MIGEITNTILGGNTASLANSARDLKALGQITSATHDLVQDPNGHGLVNGGNGNIVGLNPQLGSLASNGGPTATMALLVGSPAIDAGTNAGAPSTDQRGKPRPVNGVVDIGAFEVQVDHAPVAGNDSYATNQNTTLTVSGLAPSSGALLRYRFDEAGSGTSPAVDSGASPAATGTFLGAATRTASAPQGASTGALNLAAGQGYVSGGDADKLDGLGALTLTAWINLRAAPADQAVLMSDNPYFATAPAGNGGWELRLTKPFNSGNPLSASNFALQFQVYQDMGAYANSQYAASSALNADSRWIFVAVTYDAGHVMNYYAGDPAASVANAGGSTYAYSLGANSAPFEIGATAFDQNANDTPPAWLDDVRVYGSALTASQLDQIRREDLVPGVLGNDTDPDGDPLTAAVVAGPTHGALTFSPDGTFTYAPAQNFSGTDSFTYKANDGRLDSNVATVTLTVAPVNSTSIRIGDVSVTEGNSGTSNATFTVTLSTPSTQTVTVDYATANGTATAGTDYTAIPSTSLVFSPGETARTVTVAVSGDLLIEPDETFFVNLSGPANATIAKTRGTGKILDDDLSLAINDVRLAEGNSGTTAFTFTVSLSAAASFPVTVKYATADGTATAPADYTAINAATLTFAAGETAKTITMKVKGDTTIEADETFFVNLSGPANAAIADGQAIGTIVNDDGLSGGSINLADAPAGSLGASPGRSVGTAQTSGLDSLADRAGSLGPGRGSLDQDLDIVAQELTAMMQSQAGGSILAGTPPARPNVVSQRGSRIAPS